MIDFIKQNKDGTVTIPDEWEPLFNNIGMQMQFVRHSGKNETMAIVHIIQLTEKFFKNTPSSPEKG